MVLAMYSLKDGLCLSSRFLSGRTAWYFQIHALWRLQTFEFEPIWLHHRVQLVNTYSRVPSGFSVFLLVHRADKTQLGWNSCPRLHFGFQFGLYHLVVALSVLRSISLAYLMCIEWNLILAVCFQLKQLKKQPEKNSGLNGIRATW